MRGVIYARYSSDNQREESIEGQIRENTAFARKNGIDIVDTYIDYRPRLFCQDRQSSRVSENDQGQRKEVV